MPNKHGDFIWYELMTGDPDAAQAFYGPLLGWTFSDSKQKDRDYRIIHKSNSDIGGVMKRPDGAPVPPCWMGYILVDDVDASASSIADAGGVIHMPPQDIPKVGRLAFAADPQGVMFYILKPEAPANGADASSDAFAATEPMVGHCAWNELSTTDPDEAVAFYTAQFGWRQEDDMEMGDMGKYLFLHHGPGMIGAIMPKMPEMPSAAWTFYFRVPDIDDALDRIKQAGGQVLMEPMEIPGGDFAMGGTDPQGAAFSLVGARIL